MVRHNLIGKGEIAITDILQFWPLLKPRVCLSPTEVSHLFPRKVGERRPPPPHHRSATPVVTFAVFMYRPVMRPFSQREIIYPKKRFIPFWLCNLAKWSPSWSWSTHFGIASTPLHANISSRTRSDLVSLRQSTFLQCATCRSTAKKRSHCCKYAPFPPLPARSSFLFPTVICLCS